LCSEWQQIVNELVGLTDPDPTKVLIRNTLKSLKLSSWQRQGARKVDPTRTVIPKAPPALIPVQRLSMLNSLEVLQLERTSPPVLSSIMEQVHELSQLKKLTIIAGAQPPSAADLSAMMERCNAKTIKFVVECKSRRIPDQDRVQLRQLAKDEPDQFELIE
jgi:hypothetical protein